MQKVTQEQLQSYTKVLNSVADEATAQYKTQLKAYAQTLGDFSTWDDETKRAMQDYAAEQMRENGRIFCNANVSSAKKFATDVLNADLPKNYGADIDYIPAESAKKSAHYWAKTHLFSKNANLDSFIDGCSSKLERNVAHAADIYTANTAIQKNKGAKKYMKFARVPKGATCPFCIMLASRGFVYASAASAGELGQYHDKCDCRILAGYEGLQVENYDYEGMAERYGQCRATIWDSLPDQLEWLKSKQGLEYTEKYGSQGKAWNRYTTECILEEMDTRDRQWLFDGTLPVIEFEDEKLKKLKEKQYPHEINTAKRLRENGIKCKFIWDEVNKGARTISYADLDNGYELKTLKEAASQNTLNNYLKGASHKKENVKAVIFDNVDNINLNDDELIYLLDKTKAFKRGKIYIINKLGELVKIKRAL